MSLNSVNTNIGAAVALQSLNATSTALQSAQKQISTGYRVADATDDGAAFAIAQKVRGDVGALTSVNQQLGNAKGLVGTTVASLTSISNTFNDAQALLVKIADQGTSADQRTQDVIQFKSLVSNVANAVDGSTYNGQTLVGSVAGTPVAGAGKTVINNETGSTSSISGEDNSGTAATFAALVGFTGFSRSASGADTFAGTPTDAQIQTAAAAALAPGGGTGTLGALQKAVSSQLNQVGADSNFLNSSITFNNAKVDALNSGLGALVDADLSKESAVLQALQIKQQLGTQALSISNQAPQALLSLFK